MGQLFLILNSVTTSTNLQGYCVSGGRLNAYAALTMMQAHTHTYTSYEDFDVFQHKHLCACGHYVLENHNFIEVHIHGGMIVEPEYWVRYICNKCGHDHGPFPPAGYDEPETE